MHFRIRKNVIQLIRTTYDESKKKGNSAIIGTVPMAKPQLSEELCRKLTVEEVSAFEVWARTQYRKDMLHEEIAALTLAETILTAEKWFRREGNSDAARAVADDIVFNWQALRRVLAKNNLLD